MPKFNVWADDFCATETASDIEAASPEAAAEQYADEDSDGQSDGFYNGGATIIVRDEQGTLRHYEVTIEWSPDFFVMEKTPPPKSK